MSAAEQKAAEERLQDLNTRIQMFYKNSKDDLERQQKEKINAIHDKVKKAVQNVGKAGHYTYIFEIDAALYVGSDSKDLTSEVKSELKKLK